MNTLISLTRHSKPQLQITGLRGGGSTTVAACSGCGQGSARTAQLTPTVFEHDTTRALNTRPAHSDQRFKTTLPNRKYECLITCGNKYV